MYVCTFSVFILVCAQLLFSVACAGSLADCYRTLSEAQRSALSGSAVVMGTARAAGVPLRGPVAPEVKPDGSGHKPDLLLSGSQRSAQPSACQCPRRAAGGHTQHAVGPGPPAPRLGEAGPRGLRRQGFTHPGRRGHAAQQEAILSMLSGQARRLHGSERLVPVGLEGRASPTRDGGVTPRSRRPYSACCRARPAGSTARRGWSPWA